MRPILKTLIIIAIFIAGCKKDSADNHFNSMHFVRQGGGEIDFHLFSTDEEGKIKAEISKYDFKDTTIQFFLEQGNDHAALFSTFNKALKNEEELSGDFKQPDGMGGTWAYIYFVEGEKETAVTNTDLRDKLLEFENLVREKIQ